MFEDGQTDVDNVTDTDILVSGDARGGGWCR